MRLTASLESPFATFLEAVTIAGETTLQKAPDNEELIAEVEEEAPEEQDVDDDKKARKRSQDAASEVAGILAISGAQLISPLNETSPAETTAKSGDDLPAPTVFAADDRESQSLLQTLSPAEDTKLVFSKASPAEVLDRQLLGEISAGELPDPEKYAASSAFEFDGFLGANADSSTESGFGEQDSSWAQWRDAGGLPGQRSIEGMARSEVNSPVPVAPPFASVAELSVHEKEGANPVFQAQEVPAQLLSSKANAVAETSTEPRFGEQDIAIPQERSEGVQTTRVQATGEAASDEAPSEGGDTQYSFEQDSSWSPRSDSGDLPVQPSVEGTFRSPVQMAPALLGGSTVGGIVPTSARGALSPASMSPASDGDGKGGGAVGGVDPMRRAGPIPSDGAIGESTASGADALAVQLGGFDGAQTSGERASRAEGGQEMFRGASVDRTRILRSLERIEKTLKGLAETKEARTISLRLDPPSLGSMTVEVSFRDGELHARLAPESAQVAAMLRERSHELHTSLRKMGLWVDHVRVSIDTGTTGSGTGEGGAHQGRYWHGGDQRDFGEQVVPVTQNRVQPGEPLNSRGGVWRDGRWVA